VAYAIYVAGVRLQMRTFFKITGVLLVIFAAAILRYAVHEFEEIGWAPPIVEEVWNTGGLVSNDSPQGAVMQALLGYTPQPSLLQLITYFGYLLGVGYFFLRPARKVATQDPAPALTVPVTAPVEERSGEPAASMR
jgi:high-affinity iron transporter